MQFYTKLNKKFIW